MQGWRHQAGRPALPFAFVQISAYGATAAHPVESGWSNLRDIQRRVAEADAHAAIAVTIDLGDPLDIHPGEKHEVGQRLAQAMRALASSRSEEHTSELQSLMRISHAVFCLKTTNTKIQQLNNVQLTALTVRTQRASRTRTGNK